MMAAGLWCVVFTNHKADPTTFLSAAEACITKTSFISQPC